MDTLEQIKDCFDRGMSEEEILEELDLDPVDLLILIRKFLNGDL